MLEYGNLLLEFDFFFSNPLLCNFFLNKQDLIFAIIFMEAKLYQARLGDDFFVS